MKFYQAIHVTPAKSRVLAKLNDETPLVLERSIGEGKVLVFTSTFDNVSERSADARVLGSVRGAVRAYLGGGGAEQPVNFPSIPTSNCARATARARRPKCSIRTASACCRSKRRPRPGISRCDHEGFFEIKTASGRHSLIAVHADRRESDLTR